MTNHTPVLLGEAIDQLMLEDGDVVVDATLGGGGHAREILKRIGGNGKLIAIDADISSAKQFKKEKDERVIVINDNFVSLGNILKEIGIEKVDAIIADLGWSSDQLESVEHGMSFLTEAELDMRYDREQELTAKKIVNEYSQKDLEKIIEKYGEERFSKNIVKRIIEYRKKHTIATTTQLADIVKNAVPPNSRYGHIHPATRTFQALRIEINKELENLQKFIPQALASLKPESTSITFPDSSNANFRRSF